MPSLILDCVGVTSTDMHRTVQFYELLGFRFPDIGPEDMHLEAITEPGAVRLMIDSAELATKLIGEPPRPSNGSAFGMLCADPAEVDRVAAAIAEAGFDLPTPPWDAFWGQRYATVADPDGYLIDLFAPL
ncbi:VOC family protein [Flavimaricola marinus]|uniref:Glyoxalase-like domain protein n=1 Tax=Flavimaricola marinus TaxID=1819565 RepID=A0A238LL56_9RHOB|nr:VOC family protein [Flavimaricola marinus]SMY10368.1 Glyoxalase-like domain protein [Flavimaricola marinus]